MVKIVAVGNKVVELFEAEEYTQEAIEKAMAANDWEWDDRWLVHYTVKVYGGQSYRQEDIRVDYTGICYEKEMHYAEYKKNYSDCQTKKGSYNKETKTIVVYAH